MRARMKTGLQKSDPYDLAARTVVPSRAVPHADCEGQLTEYVHDHDWTTTSSVDKS